MKFALATVVFAASALAVPTGGGHGGHGGSSYDPCPGLIYDNPKCCATDVLGVIGLDCYNPTETPHSKDSFINTCSEKGQQARCCLLDLLGQAVLCNPPY